MLKETSLGLAGAIYLIPAGAQLLAAAQESSELTMVDQTQESSLKTEVRAFLIIIISSSAP